VLKIKTNVALALEQAAEDADFPEFPMMEFILDAVEEYLENDCPLNSLTVEELFNKIKKMLEQTGCLSIAEHLHPLSPSFKVSLKELASEAGHTYELGFFEAIINELGHFKKCGASEVEFIDSKEAVRMLTGAKRWNKRCSLLLEELKTYLEPYQLDAA